MKKKPEFPFILAIPTGEDGDSFIFKAFDNIDSLRDEAADYDMKTGEVIPPSSNSIMELIDEITHGEGYFFINKNDWGQKALEIIRTYYDDKSAEAVKKLATDIWGHDFSKKKPTSKPTDDQRFKPTDHGFKPTDDHGFKPTDGHGFKPTDGHGFKPTDDDDYENFEESLEKTPDDEINEIVTKMIYDLLETVERGGEKFSGYNKPKRTPNHPSKSHAVLAKDGSKVKLIRFGQKGVKGAGKHPSTPKEKKRRKSFKARHAKNIKKGKMSAAYWANRVKWE